MRSKSLSLLGILLFALFTCALASAQEDDQLPIGWAGLKGHSVKVAPNGHKNGMDHARFGAANIDSLVNFNGQYFVSGFDGSGVATNRWFTNTVGNPPQM